MSLSYLGSLAATSASFRDACVNESTNELVVVETSSTTIRRYNMSTRTQVAPSATVVSGAGAVCLISSASAAVASSSSSSFDFIELTSGYRTNITSMNTLFTNDVKGQLIASDQSAKVAFYCPSTAKELVRIDGNTFGGARLRNYRLNGNESFCSIIYKSPGRFLVGSDFGQVYEIDLNGIVVDQLSTYVDVTNGLDPISIDRASNIYYMAYADNILAVSFSGTNLIEYYDWTTKTLIKRLSPGGQTLGNILSNSASGVCLTARNYTVQDATGACQSVAELDLTINPGNINDSPGLMPGETTSVAGCGFNTTNGIAWAMQASNIFFWQLTPRASTTIANVGAQSPSGTNVPARILVIQDDGVGTAKIIFDTKMLGPATYRFPTGKNLIVLCQYLEGTTSRWECAEITT